MNSYENNEKQIKKLERLERVYNDDSRENKPSTVDEATKNPPLKFARRVVAGLTVLLWVMSIFMLFTGTSLELILPALMLSIGVLCGVNIPAFFAKRKFGDTVIAAIVTAVCVVGGIVLLVYGAR